MAIIYSGDEECGDEITSGQFPDEMLAYHSCPICGQACYCGGDIDDIDAGDEVAEDNCDHCDDDDEEPETD